MSGPRPDPDRPGIFVFDDPEEQNEWLEQNFPANMARIREIQHENVTPTIPSVSGDHMSSMSKQARRDAFEFARAQMYYGDGAGNRRKLIEATVDAKTAKNPAYGRAFQRELKRQDMAEHAEAARKERNREDRSEAISKNTKALASGNYGNASSTVILLIVGGYVAHQTGLDQKVYAKGKEMYVDARVRYSRWKIRRNMRVVTDDGSGS